MLVVERASCPVAFGLGFCLAPTLPILDGLPLKLYSAELGLRFAPAQPILHRLSSNLLHALGLDRHGRLLRRSLQPRFDSGLVLFTNALGDNASIAMPFHFKYGPRNVRRGFAVNALVCNELAPVRNGDACAMAIPGIQINSVTSKGAARCNQLTRCGRE